MHEPLEGIAAADAVLGRAFPLPSRPVPLARWVDVVQVAERGVEVAWSLDDTRPGSPGRLALYAGLDPPPARELPDAGDAEVRDGIAIRTAPLPEAEAGLRPVIELAWEHDELHLRLTGQGAWELDALLALAHSMQGRRAVVARLHRNEYLIVDNGVIDRPGEPSGAIPLKFARKPPGTI